MCIMNKNILFAIMSLLLLVTACNKNDDIERLQSLVFVPEHSSGCIRVDGTSPMTLRYRVEPKKMIPELVNNSKAFTFESKSLSETPSLTINTITGDATSGVLTLEVTPSAGFEHNGDYAFALHYSNDDTGFTSAFTPVLVVVHPTNLTFGGIDITQPLIAGNTYKLEPVFTPTYTTEKGVTWASSNPQVATVDENGLLSLLDNGQTTISITSTDNPDIGYSITITVSGGNIPVNPGDGTGQDQAE